MSNSALGGVSLRSWVFQNRPDRYNLGDALARSGNDDWTVSSHRTEISNGSRQAFRSPVGQLLDYGRFLQRPSCGVLLPRCPSEDTLAFARHIRFAVYWEAADGTFESEQML